MSLLLASNAEAKDGPIARPNSHPIIIEASSIHQGLSKPGRFSPGNLFDGIMSTSYCGVAGQPASVSFSVPMRGSDEGTLRGMTHVKIVGGLIAAVPRTVTIRIGYVPGSGRHQFQTSSAPLEAGESKTLPLTLPKNAIVIDVHISITSTSRSTRKQAICLGELEFQSGGKVTPLKELSAAVQMDSARYENLAKTKTRQASTENYLMQHSWLRYNPDKKHSLWETASYEFLEDGSFTRQNHPMRLNPSLRSGTWRVKKSGLVILTGDDLTRFSLVRCKNHQGYRCVNKTAMRPRQAM